MFVFQISVQLTKVFLHMENKYNLNNFLVLRQATMVALTVIDCIPVWAHHSASLLSSSSSLYHSHHSLCLFPTGDSVFDHRVLFFELQSSPAARYAGGDGSFCTFARQMSWLKRNRNVVLVCGTSGACFCSTGALESSQWKERSVCGCCSYRKLWFESIRQWQTCWLATRSRKADSKQDETSQKGSCSRWTFVPVFCFYLSEAVQSFLMCFRVWHNLRQRPPQTVMLLWLDTSFSLCWRTMTGLFSTAKLHTAVIFCFFFNILYILNYIPLC